MGEYLRRKSEVVLFFSRADGTYGTKTKTAQQKGFSCRVVLFCVYTYVKSHQSCLSSV